MTTALSALPDHELVVTGVGAVSPIGLDVPVTHNSVRTDVCRFQEVSIRARGRQPLIGCPVEGIFDDRIREDRLWRLALQAAEEALTRADTGVSERLDRQNCGVFLAVAEELRPGFGCHKDVGDRSDFYRLMGQPDKSAWLEVSSGHSSALEALGRAKSALIDGTFRACLIGGADSLLQLGVLRWFEDSDRLKTSTNSDGVIPGEAAAFVVVELAGAAYRRRAHALAHVCALGVACEASTAHSGDPCRGAALTAAVKEALSTSELSADQVDEIWCDLNGESYRSREWGLASLRVGFPDTTRVTHPADCLGDTGAACGALLLTLSAWDLAHSDTSRSSLLFTSSDSGVRAAVVLSSLEQIDGARDNESNFSAVRITSEVIEEHLEEVQSLWSLRKTILKSPDYTLPYLQRLDQRIERHFQGLRLGREPSAEATRAVLMSDDPLESLASACFLLRWGENTDQQRIADGSLRLPPEHAAPLIEALCHMNHEDPVHKRLMEALTSTVPSEFAAAAEILAFRGTATANVDVLRELTAHGSAAIRGRAWRAAAFSKQGFDAVSFDRGLSDADPSVRVEAAMGAALTGQPWFLSWCRSESRTRSDALRWLGIVGEPKDAHLLMSCTVRSNAAPEAILALGSLGFPGAIPDILKLMDDVDDWTAVAAGIAFRNITGRNVESQIRVEVPPRGTNDTGDFQSEFREEYKRPDSAAALQQWNKMRATLGHVSRLRNGLDVSGYPADSVLQRLDLEGRWEAALRASYHGLLKGRITDLLRFEGMAHRMGGFNS